MPTKVHLVKAMIFPVVRLTHACSHYIIYSNGGKVDFLLDVKLLRELGYVFLSMLVGSTNDRKCFDASMISLLEVISNEESS